jgi:hypothetical protein
MPELRISADLAKAFASVVAAADIWFVVGRELDILPKGLSIKGVCANTAEVTEEMPDDVRTLLGGLAARLHLAPPADNSYAAGTRCLLAIQQRLSGEPSP